jgi:hypothetical protein
MIIEDKRECWWLPALCRDCPRRVGPPAKEAVPALTRCVRGGLVSIDKEHPIYRAFKDPDTRFKAVQALAAIGASTPEAIQAANDFSNST